MVVSLRTPLRRGVGMVTFLIVLSGKQQSEKDAEVPRASLLMTQPNAKGYPQGRKADMTATTAITSSSAMSASAAKPRHGLFCWRQLYCLGLRQPA